MTCRNNFQNRKRFSKNVPFKAWRSSISTMYVMTSCCHKESFQKPTTPWHDYLPFFLPSLSIIHVRVYFSLPYTSWFPACLPFCVAHIFLIFSLSFSLWIKPFSFLSMTTLLCYPCHKNCLTLISFIYSHTIHYVQLVLIDVRFLKVHLSTSLAPSTLPPYLG